MELELYYLRVGSGTPISAGLAGNQEERVALRFLRQKFARKRVYAHYKKQLANC